MKADRRQALLQDATKHMNAGKFGQASKLLKELLSSEPADQKARRLSATLNLKLGNRITAKTLFETLVKEALGSQDRRLAESLLREYLEAGPRYVPFLQLLGQVCEENGNRKAAAVEYGKALTILIEDEDTEDAELPAKLYAKIKALNPTEPVLGQFATTFEPPQPAEPAQPVAEPSAQEPPVKAKGKGRVKEEVRTGRSAAPVKPSEVKPAAPRREGAKKVEASRAPAAQPSAKPHAPPPAAQAEPVVEPQASEIPVEAKGVKDLAARRLSATQKLESGDHTPARNMFAALAHEALESQDRRLAESLLREYLMAGPPFVPFLELLGRLCEEKGNHRAAAEEYGKALQVLIGDQAAGDPDLPAKLYAKVKELNPASPLLPRFAAGFEPPPPAAQADEPVVEPTALSSPPPLEVPEQRVSGDVEASVEPVEIKAAPPATPEPDTLTGPQAPPALPTEVPVEEAPAAAAPLENQKTPDLQPAMRAPEVVTAPTAEPVVSDRPEEVQDKLVDVVPAQKVEEEITPPPSEEKPHEPRWKTDFRFLESTAPPKRSYKPVAEAPLSAPPEARGVSPITAGSGADAAAQGTVADVSEEWVAAEPEVEPVVPDSPTPSADTGGPETLSFTARTSVPTPQEEIQDDLPAIGPLEELNLDETNLVPADVDTVSEGELE
ncbi:tetratricopeptide repeat protein, partial [Nitrospiraceae bacterium AH_259_D15_M11_P09]|nr:tetratricopeptide repeat protein [Nitrospiraceae bacterium AH_259_D15_M11_P09]